MWAHPAACAPWLLEVRDAAARSLNAGPREQESAAPLAVQAVMAMFETAVEVPVPLLPPTRGCTRR